MGDVAMATAVMEDLRRAFPEAVIDLNTMPAYEGLFAEDERFGRVFAVDLKGKDRGWKGIRKWLREVKAGGYDLVFDFQSNDRSWSLFALWRLSSFKVPIFVGHHKRFPYKVAPPKLDRPPRGVDGLRRMLGEMGIEANTPCPVIGVSESRVSRMNDLLESESLGNHRFILLCPGSQAGGHLKRWGAVGPQMQTIGLSAAAKICPGPVSLATTATARRPKGTKSSISVFPHKSTVAWFDNS